MYYANIYNLYYILYIYIFFFPANLVAYCHVCLTHVMGVRQVGPFVTVDERQSMKPFDSICSQPAMVGHIVLRIYGHFLQKTRKSCHL